MTYVVVVMVTNIRPCKATEPGNAQTAHLDPCKQMTPAFTARGRACAVRVLFLQLSFHAAQQICESSTSRLSYAANSIELDVRSVVQSLSRHYVRQRVHAFT